MIPTSRTVALAVAWLIAGVAASVWPAWLIPWLVAGGVIVLMLAVDALDLRSHWKFSLERRLPGRFAVGQDGEVRLDFTNHTKRRVTVEVFDGIPEGAEAEAMPWRGVVEGGRTAKIVHPVKIMERGLVAFRPMHLRARSLFGCWWRRVTVGGDEEARVFPDYEPVVRFALLATEARQDQMGIVRKSLAGSSRDFHQLREYREGDPLSQIDWKATSRRLTLISREFQEQRNQTVIFLTDTGRRMRAMDGELPQFDHCLNAMLLLSYVVLKQGDRVGVQSFGGSDRWLPPVKGQHSMAAVLNHLFDYQTTSEPSDFTSAAERFQSRQRRRTMVVVMTNLRGEDASELVPALRILTSRHLVVLASLRERTLVEARERPIDTFNDALRFAAAEHYDRERAEVMATLRGYGVITLDVPADELPIALANRYLDIKAAGRL